MKNNLTTLLPLIIDSKILQEKTPFFLYDQNQMAENMDNVFAFLDKLQLKTKKSRFYFSYKSCPCPAVVFEVLKKFSGIDVSSLNEYREVRDMGIMPQRISVSGPAKTTDFLKLLIEDNVSTLHFDSSDEIDDYVHLLEASGKKTSTQFTCRLNVDKNSSKLGMSLGDVKKTLAQNKLPFTGLHAYLGREQFSSSLLESITREFAGIVSIFPQIKDIFLGPGLREESLKEEVDFVASLIDKNVTWHFEMGRAVVDSAGYYLCPILSVKNAENNQLDLIINGGIQHYLSAFTNLLKMSTHTAQILNENGDLLAGDTEAKVYGSLCLPNDIFGWIEECPGDVKRGWWTCFYPCGAYNISASLNSFINQDRARGYICDPRAGSIESI